MLVSTKLRCAKLWMGYHARPGLNRNLILTFTTIQLCFNKTSLCSLLTITVGTLRGKRGCGVTPWIQKCAGDGAQFPYVYSIDTDIRRGVLKRNSELRLNPCVVCLHRIDAIETAVKISTIIYMHIVDP